MVYVRGFKHTLKQTVKSINKYNSINNKTEGPWTLVPAWRHRWDINNEHTPIKN